MTRKQTFTIAGALLAIATVMGVALVARRPVVDDDLRRDLALASGASSLQLAPMAGTRTQVVSAIEQVESTPAPAPRARGTASVRRPRPADRDPAPSRESEALPTPNVAQAPDREETPATESMVPEAAEPDPAPTISPPTPGPDHFPAPRGSVGRRGGGWTTADVIRNAPFPINP